MVKDGMEGSEQEGFGVSICPSHGLFMLFLIGNYIVDRIYTHKIRIYIINRTPENAE